MLVTKLTITVFTQLLLISIANGQGRICGTLTDGETGEFLEAANIHIEGTYRGTITNREGAFEIRLNTFPANLIFRYIGYVTETVVIESLPDELLHVQLTPATFEMEELVVTDEDPALRIMREVIRRKILWRANLNNYAADAYSRNTLENDTSIVSITESISNVYWDTEKGSREVITSNSQTSNMDLEGNFAASSYMANFYNDDIDIAGFDIVGVTHPDALKFYNFELEGYNSLDDQQVYRISVEPGRDLQPLFEGNIAVLGGEYALLEVDLKPNEVVRFPPPIRDFDVSFQQQFSNFGEEFWLPVDMRMQGSITISMPGLRFPAMNIHQVTRISDYKVNTTLPDSVYESKEWLQVDSLSVAGGTIEVQDRVPLSMEEEEAYETIDSTMTLEKAFQPKGALARQFNTDESEGGVNLDFLPAGLAPQMWYNRVDALHAGLQYSRIVGEYFSGKITAGYNTGYEDYSYSAVAEARDPSGSGFFAEGGYRNQNIPRQHSYLYPRVMTTTHMLIAGGDDYFDYYQTKGWFAYIGRRISQINTRFKMGWNHESHYSLEKKTNYSFVGGYIQRENPPIGEGLLRSITLQAAYGDDVPIISAMGSQGMTVDIEHANDGWMDGDFSFTKYSVNIDWRFPTFLKRRMFPNVLDVRLNASTSTGELPVQRYGSIDGRLGSYLPFGGFKASAGIPYEGEHHAVLFWEHNFRTVPFEILGLRGFADRGLSMILHGASGKTWISEKHLLELEQYLKPTKSIHHEAGISVNNIFSVLRIDTGLRLDKPGYYIGFGIARIF
ncbi:MAG: DUF5686 family protein [Balneolales bacterium]